MSAAILYSAMIAVHSIAIKKNRRDWDMERIQCRDVFANIVYSPNAPHTSRYIILAPLVFTAAFIFVHSVTFYINTYDHEKQFVVSAMSLLFMLPALCFTVLKIGKRPLDPRVAIIKVVTLFLIYLSIQIAFFVSNEKQPCMITSGMFWLIVIIAMVTTYILERRRPLPKLLGFSKPQGSRVEMRSKSNQVRSKSNQVVRRFGS